MTQKNINEIMADVDKLLADCDEFNKELKFQQDNIEFLINEWRTNKRYFKDEPGHVTVEDVIKTVFYFAWGSRGNYEHINNKND